MFSLDSYAYQHPLYLMSWLELFAYCFGPFHDVVICCVQLLMDLEEFMLGQVVPIPVYFAEWNHDLQNIYSDIKASYTADDRSSSATEGTVTHLARTFVDL